MTIVQWKIRAIRGATTVTANTIEAIREAVTELLEAIEIHNSLDPDDIVSIIFTATQDLDAIFPAAIARERPHWQNVPLLDVQQMHVAGSLEKCIRVILHVNTPKLQSEMQHVYLQGAKNLRPDWQISPVTINR
ncbi:MAG: chorismate mutase [Microcystis sp. M038S2]|jgi:chorismate mutase|uniref:chorismate mutase n=2 Tax=Microcystis TaxID=1125 RepID=A0ABR8HZW7_9CHRO|nr:MULTISPECIES: chorismate mutase [Microcystis]MCU7243023.1 chorismate mutase [Microcystis aeruginosa WS75]NCQ71458.1 chorismate mutase [Microcystis aeruginosa W13-16]NCQ75975.1 chorismate mutase [Microcystis aeruginosa W13-13]NCQ80421.1 chorismate mutase [Microcystis aeruginosa W13-15]NCQ84470.1 chorismate mutase [Microcystis aeruginosa W13-18]NCR13877.1 chorismate mutase [Microcystis aeruginosa SX13-11]NCR16605.1 chorismate mutase [Microcystis aeruginosa LL13-03]NCR23464.1 chorismate mut